MLPWGLFAGAESTEAGGDDYVTPPPTVDLPRVDSGMAELNLADHLYPEAGNQDRRRAALERVLAYFPNDRDLEFRVEVRLAILDWNAGAAEKANARISRLLAKGSSQLQKGTFSWGEAVYGRILADLGQTDEALKRMDRVALDHTAPLGRRVAAALACSELKAKDSPRGALDWLLSFTAQTHVEGAEIESSIARLLLEEGRIDDLAQRLAVIAGDRPKGDAALVDILQSAETWNQPGDAERFGKLVEAVSAAQPDPTPPLREALDRFRSEKAIVSIQVKLFNLLSEKPLSDWFRRTATDPRTPLESFAKAITEGTKRCDPERCLRLSLRALASHPKDETLPHVLWEAAGFADWIERVRPKAVDPRVCPLLLSLCEQLPVSNPYFIEGKFLAAERMARMGDRAGEQAELNEILALPILKPQYTAPACRMLGADLESMGRYRQALEVYAGAEPLVGTFSTAAECVLHAVWINLSLGNDAEAIRLIRVLSTAPETLTRNLPGGAQLEEFESLIRTGKATECWAAGRTWWAEWEKVAIAIGAPADLPAYGVPEIGNTADLEESIRRALKDGEGAAYLKQLSILMSAARWQPSLVPEAAGLIGPAIKMSVSSGDDFRGVLIRMLAGPHPPEIAGLRERKLCLAINLLDVHQSAEALEVAKDFFSSQQPEDNTTRAMHRVRALAALAADRDYAECATGLEADLCDPNAGVQRAMAVGLLSDLYQRLGRDLDAGRLLNREMNNRAIVADEQGRASLRSRLEKLERPKNAPPLVAQWIDAAGLNWYDYAEPKSLADPRVASLGDALENSERVFGPVEQVKLLLLAAQDAKRSTDDCNRLFLQAAVRIINWAGDYDRLEALAASIVDNPSFDLQVRMGVLWNVLSVLAREGQAADFRLWRQNRLCQQMGSEYKEFLALLDLEVDLPRKSTESIVSLANSAGSKSISAPAILLVRDCLDLLLRKGALADAEALAKRSEAWTFSGDAASSADAVRLEFARKIRVAQLLNPAHEALAAAVAALYPTAPVALPPEYSRLRLASGLPKRGPKATLDAGRWLIAHHKFDRNDFQFWSAFLEVLPTEDGPKVGTLIGPALRAAASDELRSQLIVLFFSSLNFDNPNVRREMENAFAPYRQATESPLSYLTVRLYEIHRDLRLGKPTTLESEFVNLDDPRALVVRQRTCLRFFTQTRAKEALQKAIDQIEPARLISPEFLTQSLPAFEFLQSKPELNAARDAGTRLVHEDVLDSWARGNDVAGAKALELAVALGDRALLPKDWIKDVSAGNGDPFFRCRVLLTVAYLESDWTEVERIAESMNDAYPSCYTIYWYRGLALHHLGRDREATVALTPYLEHAKDDPDYLKAVDLSGILGRDNPGHSRL